MSSFEKWFGVVFYIAAICSVGFLGLIVWAIVKLVNHFAN